ncbi:MAG: GIY-YIG nuclease family protein [Alphaproteobacteria bacterium]|nr:GIY-YIG nuclease family protein [Alphaproteobacteria bacterium]
MTELLDFPARPKIYAYTLPEYKDKNWLKIGYTTRDVRERVNEQHGVLKPIETAAEIVFETDAVRDDGTLFLDHDFHRYIKQNCIKHLRGEWYEITLPELKAAMTAFKKRRPNVDLKRTETFSMRPEQRDAVDMTAAYFKVFSVEKTGKTPHFLWNAKMRFGKTFAAYQLAKKMGWKKILVLTFKPAVQSAWESDLKTHTDFSEWQFVVNDGEGYQRINKSKPFVWFASFQDLLGKNELGGIKTKNEIVHAINWDCIILDEYHFGAWRDRAKDLYDAEEKEENPQIDDYDEELMPLTTNAYLYLSGTPFRALNNGEFLEDQIFNWTYTDEQRAKREWNEETENPYLELPQMVMMTYRLPREIREIALQGEFDEFDLNEFFKTENKDGEPVFKHENEVKNWLDLIHGQYLPTEIDSLKTGKRPPMPFSDVRLTACLRHTLWFLPNVGACKAMEKLLKNHSFYGKYKVVCCAGQEAGIGVDALPPVTDAIGNNPLNTLSITLSCGKLMTGVSVKAWGGILMLRNTSSPETYFQAAFRVQTPFKLVNPTGVYPNETQIVKPVCYVFDFAPDRALKQIAEYSGRLDLNSPDSPEQKVSEFVKFLPVLCYDGETMNLLDAGQLLDMVVSGTASTMLARRWESALLVNVDNETLKKLLNNPKAMEALERIEGFRGLNKELSTIVNRSEALKKTKKEASGGESAAEKRELTKEEKEIKSKRKIIQEKLLKFATRIPVFMYLTDAREQTLKDVITQLEPALFRKVTGLTIPDFELLVSIGIFNAQVMNSAILAFKRYEEASLIYTGLNRHENELIGGWDTTFTVEEMRQM